VRNTLAIAERELRSYLMSPVPYVVTALFLFIAALLFALPLSRVEEATLRYWFSNLGVIWLIVLPALTMRLIAEEARSGTIELLLTNPVRDAEVVIGKYLAALGFFGVMLLFTLYYPIMLMVFGNPDRGPMVVGYLGVTLLGASFLAVGLWASSITQNQIVAYFTAFAILLTLWLGELAAEALGRPFGEIMRYLTVSAHYQDFLRGVVDTTHVIYFLSIVAAGLFLTFLSLQTRRWRA
jgi:ABC-2 type transport system permease protein